MQPEIKIESITCPNCSSKNIKRSGIKRKKFQTHQKYQCKDCQKTFTLQSQTKNKTYPIKIILTTISYHNIGYSQNQTSTLINKKYKIKPSQKTISNWINEFKPVTTFYKLRSKAIKLYTKDEIIEKHTFLHSNLPYTFQVHKAKLELLFKDFKYNNQFINLSKFYEPIKSYLKKIQTDKFPHHIFKEKAGSDADIEKLKNVELKSKLEQRASQLKFPHLKMTHLKKQNLANKLAKLALNLAKTNKDRHNTIQNFFLINDSTTIATEIPVYLTNDDIKYFQKRNFKINLENYSTPITGHIDILQIRNGLIHILDYKPDADKITPVEQLTIYALAFASRTKLALSDFKCAWFDEDNYYEFFPLHAVYLKR